MRLPAMPSQWLQPCQFDGFRLVRMRKRLISSGRTGDGPAVVLVGGGLGDGGENATLAPAPATPIQATLSRVPDDNGTRSLEGPWTVGPRRFRNSPGGRNSLPVA